MQLLTKKNRSDSVISNEIHVYHMGNGSSISGADSTAIKQMEW